MVPGRERPEPDTPQAQRRGLSPAARPAVRPEGTGEAAGSWGTAGARRTGESRENRRIPENWRGRPWGPASRISSQRGDTARVWSDPRWGDIGSDSFQRGPWGKGTHPLQNNLPGTALSSKQFAVIVDISTDDGIRIITELLHNSRSRFPEGSQDAERPA